MPDTFTNGSVIVYAADDADLTSITYSGAWSHTGKGDWNDAYRNTASGALTTGSSASMQFDGLAVLAFAALPADLPKNASLTPPTVSVQLDKDTPTKVTIPVATETYFFSAGPLDGSKPHTITITVEEATDDFPFALDLIAYGTYQNTTKPSGQDTLDDADTTGLLQGLIPKIEAAQNKEDSTPVGPIVGGVIGGTALLVIISLAVWYLFVRPRRRGGRAFFYAPAKISDMLSGEASDAKPDPYPLTLPTTAPRMSYASTHAPVRQATYPAPSELSSSQSGPESVAGGSSYGYGVGMSGPSSAELAAHKRKAEMAGVLSVPQQTTYHADSGIRFADPGAAGSSAAAAVPDLADVPPTYSEK